MSKQSPFLLAGVLLLGMGVSGFPQAARSRISGRIDEGRLHRLVKNTYPLARAEFDWGAAPDDLALNRMLLVLTPSAERQSALATLLNSQQDKSSAQYHKWLTPQEFGERFGVGAADISQVTGWLQGHGFTVERVSNGRNFIEFSGTAGQLNQAFHTQMHRYVVNGKEHWANAGDPQIPLALAPVVAGVSTLHNFRKASQIAALKPQAVRISARGASPQFTASNGEHALAPADLATIYNINPLYGQGITGEGTTIAVVARTNINMQDIQDFQNAFGVPSALPQVVLNGADPGDLGSGDEVEAVLDSSWSAGIAPGATVKLVVSASTNTTDGVDLSELYIVENNLADVMTESYGDCEANYTKAEAQFYSLLAQQAAAQGITYTVAAGDSGAAGCDDPGSVTVASGPVSVNVLASTPYNIAVGGTEFKENGNASFWAAANGGSLASVQSYIPEVVWNESCTAAQCGSSNAGIWAAGGGASILFSKPSWQAGVAGIPDDGARDVPDVSLSSAGHDFYLLCLNGSCTTKLGQSSFSGVSGTSAATPSFAAIMALVVQYTGSRQGQANSTLYKLAAAGALASCNSASAAANCIFNDITSGNNAVPGETGYGTSTASYQAGVGYDLATGLGSVNVNNLVTGWNGTGPGTPQVRIGIESPSSLNGTVIGSASFSGWALADTGSITSVIISIDSVRYGNAAYGASRTDICALYPAANCPDVGWSYGIDTTMLANGAHKLGATVTTTTGQVYTASSNFTVANWTVLNPMKITIDIPSSSNATVSGAAHFAGWALDDQSAIAQVAVAIDGVSYGNAIYGDARPDVCTVFPGRAGCPNTGWDFNFDSTQLAEGAHTLSVTSTSAGGQTSTISRMFNVANVPANAMTISIDTPSLQSGAFSGIVNFGGWATGTSAAVSNVAITIDGEPYGAAVYGGTRQDVCNAHPGLPSCPNVGWNLGLDTTRLINGLHILGVTTYSAAGQRANATQTFSVANAASASPILITIDIPNAQNSILLGPVTFAGWAIDTDNTIGAVAVSIDGAPYGAAQYGENRPDVCAAYPAATSCPNVGWSLTVDTSYLANGIHTVTMTATDSAGAQLNTVSGQFTVANWTSTNPMKLTIDAPNSQSSPLSGLAAIGGWAIDQLAPIQKVTLAVDDVPLGNAIYGSTRTDVCAVFTGAIGCPNVGWNYGLDTRLLSDGTHTLSVTGTTAAGRSSTWTTQFQVANASTSPMHVNIDTPSPGETMSGVSATGGWALDTGGAQIISVVLLVDGQVNGTAIYGGTRSDVCARIPTGGGCPNVGWNYLLDTTVFANGIHRLAARGLAADGSLFTTSTTFTVANQP